MILPNECVLLTSFEIFKEMKNSHCFEKKFQNNSSVVPQIVVKNFKNIEETRSDNLCFIKNYIFLLKR